MNLLSTLSKALAWLALAMLVVPGTGPGWTLEAGPKRENRTEVKRQAERKVEQRRESTRERQQVRERARERTRAEAPREKRGTNRYEVRKPGREVSFTVARSKAKFQSPELLREHVYKHGRDFGLTKPKNASSNAFQRAHEKAYERRAADFMGGRTRQGVWQGTRPESRDVVRYDPKTREFGVINREGKILTYYKLPRNKNEKRYFEDNWRYEKKDRPKRNGSR